MIKAWCERCPSVYNVYMIKVCCLSYKLFFTGFNKACRGVAATSFPQGFFCVWHFSYLPLFTLICVCFHHFLSSVLCQLCSLPELDKSQFGCVSLSRPISLVAPLPHSFSHSISLSLYIYIWSSSCACAVFLTVWSWSCQWSTGQPVGPWACCQSQHPPAPESGTRGTCSSPPVAGVWFCRAS